MPRRRRRPAPTPFQIAMAQRPHSNTYKIVFPWMFGGYSKSEFNQNLCQGRVTEQDVDRVLKELKRCPNYKPTMSCGKTGLLILSMVGGTFLMAATIMYFVLKYVGNKNKNVTVADENGRLKKVVENEPLSASVYVVFIVGMIVSCCMLICCQLSIRRSYNRKIERREKELGKILNGMNEKEFSSKQVSWRIGKLGAWVSLELDFVIAQMNGEDVGGRKIKC